MVKRYRYTNHDWLRDRHSAILNAYPFARHSNPYAAPLHKRHFAEPGQTIRTDSDSIQPISPQNLTTSPLKDTNRSVCMIASLSDETMLSHTVAADVPIGAVPIEVSRADSHPKSAQFEKFAPKPAAEEFDGGALYIMTHFMMVMSLVTTHAFLSRVGAIMTAMVGAKAFKPSLNQPVLFALSMIVGGVVVFQMFSVAIGH